LPPPPRTHLAEAAGAGRHRQLRRSQSLGEVREVSECAPAHMRPCRAHALAARNVAGAQSLRSGLATEVAKCESLRGELAAEVALWTTRAKKCSNRHVAARADRETLRSGLAVEVAKCESLRGELAAEVAKCESLRGELAAAAAATRAPAADEGLVAENKSLRSQLEAAAEASTRAQAEAEAATRAKVVAEAATQAAAEAARDRAAVEEGLVAENKSLRSELAAAGDEAAQAQATTEAAEEDCRAAWEAYRSMHSEIAAVLTKPP